MTKMGEKEFQEYLQEPHIAHLVTIDTNGYPLVTPIWYLYNNEEFYVISGRNSHKIRNLVSNSNVALSIANDERPHKYIAVQGNAEVIESFDPEIVRTICIRYDGVEQGNKFVEDLLKVDMVVIRIRVRNIRTYAD